MMKGGEKDERRIEEGLKKEGRSMEGGRGKLWKEGGVEDG